MIVCPTAVHLRGLLPHLPWERGDVVVYPPILHTVSIGVQHLVFIHMKMGGGRQEIGHLKGIGAFAILHGNAAGNFTVVIPSLGVLVDPNRQECGNGEKDENDDQNG